MAVINKKGFIQGRVGGNVYRQYRGQQIIQGRPKKFRQSDASKAASLEFGLCANTARVLRQAFAPVYDGYDGAMINRLTGTVQRCIKASPLKKRGERSLHDGHLDYLKGFQFNAHSPLDKVLNARPLTQLKQGQIQISLPAISWRDIRGPRSASYSIRFLLIAFDFNREVYSYIGVKEIRIEGNSFEGGEFTIEGSLPGGSLLLLSMSLHAYGSDNFEGNRPLNSSAWSPAELIGAWQTEALENEVSPTPLKVLDYLHLFYQKLDMYYIGNNLNRQILLLKVKDNPPKRKAPLVNSSKEPGLFKLPPGDIPF